ncbi:hypothetical protein [Ruicaihuangia caeni]|uniref:Glycerophosphoryl diester phosphodiesterase membrane domain-containing protein n=1 Tax=Ruicaihuangia caeni TaxID=3042517 RepID=A0AAW6TAU7_9MICO|nr:hypothetical protein [Klugiella sp. YN-L-19]MDI2099448.1 hypothetical protein [Klugiella sp. YN-L-19]
MPPAYGAPPYGAPAYGAPGGQPYGAPQATGWTPPPKPGLIPLRPLSLGDVLGASFQVLRRNPKPTFGVSLLWQAIVIVLTVVLMGGVTALVVWRTSMASGADADAVAAGGVAAILVSAAVPLLLSVVAAGLMQGIIALEVARGAVGEKLRFRGLWRSARGRLGALVGWTLLVTLAVLIAIGIVVAAVVGLGFAVGGAVGIAIAVVLSIFAVLGALAIGAWLGTKLALVPSALMIERLPLREAVARSWTLVSGHFWRSFGILLLVAVILNVASQIVTTPMSLLLGMVTPLFSLDDNETSAVVTGLVVYLLLIAVSLVVAAVALVVQAATASLIYIDLRMRKEGLDLELQRFVEARHQPGADARDPLLPGSTARGAEPGWSAQA